VAVADLPLLATLKSRLHWHQSRQGVLAENVANANTPNFKPKDLKQPTSAPPGPTASAAPMSVTNVLHLAGLSPARPGEERAAAKRFEVVPSGNAVNLEDEMLKSAQNQSDFQLAASLYQKSLKMLATAVGKRA
jgi:flagellar basal-body rod protein FlgB